MNDRHDEYRRKANDAEEQADRASNDYDRASWLRIAHGWMSMLPKRRATASEKFEGQVRVRGTGQQKNESSN